MITDIRGLYVHIPFCIRKCNYCDFASLGGSFDEHIDAYIDRLLSEAEEYRENEKVKIDTLYFGGGTPSLLSPKRLERILLPLSDIFDFSSDLEFTLEANPGTLDYEKAVGYRSLGVNRISMGLQSIHENELKILGRIHTYTDFLECYSALRRAGFENLNVDLMYGIPECTVDSFGKTLDAVTALSPEHVSAYGLIVEEGTPFYKMRKTLALPTEDEEADMYYLASEKLARAGYSHYEISNYARAGRESRHNLRYWHDEEYIGIGVSAYSYYKNKRYGNTRSLKEYLSSAPRENYEEIDGEAERFEYAMMHLRLSSGIDLAVYKERFGTPFAHGKEDRIAEYSERGLVSVSGNRLSLTEQGFYLSNMILSDLL